MLIRACKHRANRGKKSHTKPLANPLQHESKSCYKTYTSLRFQRPNSSTKQYKTITIKQLLQVNRSGAFYSVYFNNKCTCKMQWYDMHFDFK